MFNERPVILDEINYDTFKYLSNELEKTQRQFKRFKFKTNVRLFTLAACVVLLTIKIKDKKKEEKEIEE